jgi:uncharacterized protein (TIGR03000 family)
MVYKYLIVPALLCAGLLLNANAAYAQRGGGGRGGGGGAHVSGARGGSSFHGSAYYHNGRYYGYGGPVIGIGLYGGGYGYGYSYPYSYPYYDYPLVVPRVAYYPPQAPLLAGQLAPSDPQAAASTSANVRVLVPDEKAKIWFDGTLTSQGGTDRLYHTPNLSGSGPFSYRVRAAWMVNGKEVVQESVAQVVPGQTTNVDFTRPPSEPLPAPKKD